MTIKLRDNVDVISAPVQYSYSQYPYDSVPAGPVPTRGPTIQQLPTSYDLHEDYEAKGSTNQRNSSVQICASLIKLNGIEIVFWKGNCKIWQDHMQEKSKG